MKYIIKHFQRKEYLEAILKAKNPDGTPSFLCVTKQNDAVTFDSYQNAVECLKLLNNKDFDIVPY